LLPPFSEIVPEKTLPPPDLFLSGMLNPEGEHNEDKVSGNW
jgi:hypothetical protein